MISAYETRGEYKNRLFRNSRPAGNNPKGSSEVIVEGGIDSLQTVGGSGCGQTTCKMVEKKKKKVKNLENEEEKKIPV